MRYLELQPHTLSHLDTVVIMSPKRSTEVRKGNLAKARESLEPPATQSDLASALAISQENLADARTQMTSLELEVEKLQATSAKLLEDLDAANSKIADLNLALQAERERSKDMYQSLRTERRARQRGDKRKQVLALTVSELRETTDIQLQKQKELEKSAAITDSEKKQIELSNNQLRANLLSSVQIFSKELELLKELLSSSRAALKGSKSEVYNLKRRYSHAAKKQENAVQQAQTITAKEKTTFYLLHKGVYSQEVRNLVRTLIHAGCSQEHIMNIIKAVLETAGITAVGNISSRTVGRIIREGYYAACIQLGYEINQANSEKYIFNLLLLILIISARSDPQCRWNWSQKPQLQFSTCKLSSYKQRRRQGPCHSLSWITNFTRWKQ